MARLLSLSLPLIVLISQQTAGEELAGLPVEADRHRTRTDFLIDPAEFRAGAYRSSAGDELVLSNGLIRGVFRLEPNAACAAFVDLRTDASLLRAVRPEAVVLLDGTSYPVGGLIGQPNHAYPAEALLDQMTADSRAFRFESFRAFELIHARRCRRVSPIRAGCNGRSSPISIVGCASAAQTCACPLAA